MEHGSGALASTNEVRAQNNRLRPAAMVRLASPTRAQGNAATTAASVPQLFNRPFSAVVAGVPAEMGDGGRDDRSREETSVRLDAV
jgi:hypothetical protein